jgi:hypothetical protein
MEGLYCIVYKYNYNIKAIESDPSPFERRLCTGALRGASNITFTYPNAHLDMHVFHQKRPLFVALYGGSTNYSSSFQLEVLFQGIFI